MTRAIVVGGSLGGLTAALVLQDQGWQVDVFEREPVPLEGRGAGIVVHPATVRYLVERAGVGVADIGVAADRLRYLDDDGGVAHEQQCSFRFASYSELYRALYGRFGPEHYHLSAQLERLDNGPDTAAVHLVDGRRAEADLVVCADGVRSTARRMLVPSADPRYAGYVAWRGTIGRDQLSAATADLLGGAITYRLLPHGHLLTYPIPSPDGALLCNWLWYRNVPPGPALRSLLTGNNGFVSELSVPPGFVQDQHLDELRSAAAMELPPPLAEIVRSSEQPFIQAVADLEVPRMAFGRTCLIGDAAFALRPHIAVGSAKAADDAWQLGSALRGATAKDVPLRLRSWESQQLAVAERAVSRACAAGRSVQFDGTWKVGDPLPFGLHTAGDSALPTEPSTAGKDTREAVTRPRRTA